MADEKKGDCPQSYGPVKCRIDFVYPFSDGVQAIHYYVLRNPARQKAVNLLEPDRIRSAGGGACDNADLWASLCLAIAAMLKRYTWFWQLCFALYWFDIEKRYSKSGLAMQAHVSTWALTRKLDCMFDDLEAELIRRELLMPKDLNRLN